MFVLGFFLVQIPVFSSGSFIGVASAQVFTSPPTASKDKARPKPDRRTKTRQRENHKAMQGENHATRSAALQQPAAFVDPASFCTAVPNGTMPDPRYVGLPLPGWIGQAVEAQAPALKVQPGVAVNWRCRDGQVLACASPADGDRCSKPTTATVPSETVTEFCSSKRRGKIPDEVADNTLAIWVCKDRKAEIAGYRTGIDHEGYDGSRWADVTEFSPVNRIGDMPRLYRGNWIYQVKQSFLAALGQSLLLAGRPAGASIRAVTFEIAGGRIGQSIGQISYYIGDQQGAAQLACKGDMILLAATPLQLEFEERLRGDSPLRCTGTERLTLQLKTGRLLVEWRVQGKMKPSRSGWVERVAN